MSSKSLAKAAREAIDRQDYGTALRLCDSGLEIEDNHYQLLVFKAVSLQNLSRIPDAIESYKLAIAVQPTLSLAWQVFYKILSNFIYFMLGDNDIV